MKDIQQNLRDSQVKRNSLNPFQRPDPAQVNNEKNVMENIYYRSSSAYNVENENSPNKENKKRYSSVDEAGLDLKSIYAGLKLVLTNANFVKMCMALTMLYFVITGI